MDINARDPLSVTLEASLNYSGCPPAEPTGAFPLRYAPATQCHGPIHIPLEGPPPPPQGLLPPPPISGTPLRWLGARLGLVPDLLAPGACTMRLAPTPKCAVAGLFSLLPWCRGFRLLDALFRRGWHGVPSFAPLDARHHHTAFRSSGLAWPGLAASRAAGRMDLFRAAL